MLKAMETIKSTGGVTSFFKNIKTVISNGEGNLFTKDLLKGGIKATFKDVDTYIDLVGAVVNNITYDKESRIQIN